MKKKLDAYTLFLKLRRLYWKIPYYLIRKKYNIPLSFRFNGEGIHIYGQGRLLIGENSYIGSLSSIQLHKNAIVKIGKGCSISHNVRMYTSSNIPDYDFSSKNFKDTNEMPNKVGDIEIGDYVWIGVNVFINPGIKIGTNSVIGANSVVTKDVEPNAIYGGVPAKLIRMKKCLNV